MHDTGRPLSGHRVLVVEDDYFISQEVRSVLMDAGAEVEGPFGTLKHALSAVKRDGFDLAVLDLNLRGASGYPVAASLKEAGVPFIFASGYTGSSVPEEWRDVPNCGKPCRAERLVAMLASVIGQRAISTTR